MEKLLKLAIVKTGQNINKIVTISAILGTAYLLFMIAYLTATHQF